MPIGSLSSEAAGTNRGSVRWRLVPLLGIILGLGCGVGVAREATSLLWNSAGVYCGSFVQPVENRIHGCGEILTIQMVKVLIIFYTAEVLLITFMWLLVETRMRRRGIRLNRNGRLLGVLLFLLSPILLLPGQAVGSQGSWNDPRTAASVLLFLAVIPVPALLTAIRSAGWLRSHSAVKGAGGPSLK